MSSRAVLELVVLLKDYPGSLRSLMSAIARHYNADANKEGRWFAFAPLEDIDQATWDAMPAWQQDSVDAAPFFRKSKPRAEKPEPAETPPATNEEPT